MATMLGQQNVPDMQIDTMLGHSIAGTEKKYIHFKPNYLAEAKHAIETYTYLENVSIDPTQIKIDGASTNPEKLIPLLENSTLFQNVVFAAPSFRNPAELKTRFSVTFGLEQSAIPK